MDLLGTTIGSQENPLACPIAVSRVARSTDDDESDDVNSLYVETIDRNRTHYNCTICGRKLSRKQRIETHLNCVHSKGEK